jgi:hypothetical protein
MNATATRTSPRQRRLEQGNSWLGFDISGESEAFDAVVEAFPDVEHGAVAGSTIRFYFLPLSLCGPDRYRALVGPVDHALNPDLPVVLSGPLRRNPNGNEFTEITLWLSDDVEVDDGHDGAPGSRTSSDATTGAAAGLESMQNDGAIS